MARGQGGTQGWLCRQRPEHALAVGFGPERAIIRNGAVTAMCGAKVSAMRAWRCSGLSGGRRPGMVARCICLRQTTFQANKSFIGVALTHKKNKRKPSRHKKLKPAAHLNAKKAEGASQAAPGGASAKKSSRPSGRRAQRRRATAATDASGWLRTGASPAAQIAAIAITE